jgi:response regulator RpfG family c-di-GMP phosphodiesterase
MAHEKAESILRDGAGTQWDPDLVSAFLSAVPDIVAIRHRYRPRIPVDRKAGSETP